MFQVIAISIGASFGAVLRWWVGVLLNDVFPSIPLGTLSVNLLGGYLIGFAASYFAFSPGIAPEWRLMLITGFLGSLTTFSAFSIENVVLLKEGKYLLCAVSILAHVGGTILTTLLGVASFELLKR